MKTIYRLEDFESIGLPISLTIGNFDGVHLGHQAILSKLQNHKVVVTFSNHPLEVLKSSPFYRLTTISHRLNLLEKQGVEVTVMLPFTEAFSKQTPEEFLLKLRASIPFSHLCLGHDAALGAERQGDSTFLETFARAHHFTFERVEAVKLDHSTVSSSKIRAYIQSGEFENASTLLGRPYSIRSLVEPGARQGRILGFQTANLKVHTLCLPPLGVYSVRTYIDGKPYLGVANLGRAPTLHADRPPILEVHLIDFSGDLYSQELEVFFLKFLRPEKRFESIDALQAQISTDIKAAKKSA